MAKSDSINLNNRDLKGLADITEKLAENAKIRSYIGGRLFQYEKNSKNSVSLNTVVKAADQAFQKASISGEQAKLAKKIIQNIEEMDKAGSKVLEGKNPIIKALTWLNSRICSLFYNRTAVINKLKASIPSEQPISSKDLQPALKNNDEQSPRQADEEVLEVEPQIEALNQDLQPPHIDKKVEPSQRQSDKAIEAPLNQNLQPPLREMKEERPRQADEPAAQKVKPKIEKHDLQPPLREMKEEQPTRQAGKAVPKGKPQIEPLKQDIQPPKKEQPPLRQAEEQNHYQGFQAFEPENNQINAPPDNMNAPPAQDNRYAVLNDIDPNSLLSPEERIQKQNDEFLKALRKKGQYVNATPIGVDPLYPQSESNDARRALTNYPNFQYVLYNGRDTKLRLLHREFKNLVEGGDASDLPILDMKKDLKTQIENIDKNYRKFSQLREERLYFDSFDAAKRTTLDRNQSNNYAVFPPGNSAGHFNIWFKRDYKLVNQGMKAFDFNPADEELDISKFEKISDERYALIVGEKHAELDKKNHECLTKSVYIPKGKDQTMESFNAAVQIAKNAPLNSFFKYIIRDSSTDPTIWVVEFRPFSDKPLMVKKDQDLEQAILDKMPLGLRDAEYARWFEAGKILKR